MPEIIFTGRSNVGKSSLIRALSGKKVPVGKRPGVTLAPLRLRFADLTITDMPGFGFMSGVDEKKRERIKDVIVKYIEDGAAEILLAVLVVDARSFSEVVDRWRARDEIPVEVEMFEFLHELDLDVVVAVNKMDNVSDRDEVLDGIAQRLGMFPPWRQWTDVIAPVSAKKGDVGAISSLIKGRLHSAKRDDLLRFIR
ncbi:MAG TPA: GTP-binding protein EngB [Candidatus Methanoperedenaceae archaeon]|nr:GTP-binding protein EngB [Candidatus Methanoperedenaceae archaeon]